MSNRPTPYIPSFPYTGSQLYLKGGRVVLHGRKDAILLFGKKAIGLSSLGRVNVDSGEGVTINSPEIELGLGAKEVGQPVAKAGVLVEVLTKLVKRLDSLSNALATQNPVVVSATASTFVETLSEIKELLPEIKSNVTFTV
jgi:hypothetical protein